MTDRLTDQPTDRLASYPTNQLTPNQQMDMRVQEGAVTLPTSGSGPVKVIESVLVSQ